jgi:hypothetical protein
MRMIIGRRSRRSTPQRATRALRWRDDNSLKNVQSVRVNSAANRETALNVSYRLRAGHVVYEPPLEREQMSRNLAWFKCWLKP